MRSTRATAALARLNSRSEGHQYLMVLTGSGQFILRERTDGGERPLSEALALDDFVRLLDSMGPRKVVRVTKSEAAFMKQLGKKT
ncbi:MAG: hypothetical protein NDI91_04035 [Sulfuritalea sp.]|nr:hypothetical protein [Sulfuritalea sp.]